MTPEEVGRFRHVRELVAERGRPFVGYIEPQEGAYFQSDAFTLHGYFRNEVQLNRSVQRDAERRTARGHHDTRSVAVCLACVLGLA